MMSRTRSHEGAHGSRPLPTSRRMAQAAGAGTDADGARHRGLHGLHLATLARSPDRSCAPHSRDQAPDDFTTAGGGRDHCWASMTGSSGLVLGGSGLGAGRSGSRGRTRSRKTSMALSPRGLPAQHTAIRAITKTSSQRRGTSSVASEVNQSLSNPYSPRSSSPGSCAGKGTLPSLLAGRVPRCRGTEFVWCRTQGDAAFIFAGPGFAPNTRISCRKAVHLPAQVPGGTHRSFGSLQRRDELN